MKTIVKNTLFAVAMLVLTSVSAARKVNISVSQVNSVVSISLKNIEVGERLMIKNFKGIAMFKKTFKVMSNFDKNFSLKSVKNGMYFVEVENGDHIEITPVLKNDLGVTLIQKAAKFVFKPQFLVDGDLFKVSLMNANQEQVNIKIYGQNGDIILSEELLDEYVVTKNYDTSKLDPGMYNMTINKAGKTFFKEFNVR